jgi:hypothetical protein
VNADRVAVRLSGVAEVGEKLCDRRVERRYDSRRGFRGWGGKGPAADDEVAGVNSFGHGNTMNCKPVQGVLDAVHGRPRRLSVRGLEGLLVFPALEAEAGEVDAVLLAEVGHKVSGWLEGPLVLGNEGCRGRPVCHTATHGCPMRH